MPRAQVYIHSKLLVVDDRATLCASANINERSLRAFSDSEVGVLIEDTQMVPSALFGAPWMAGTFSASLRRALMREHMALDPLHSAMDRKIEVDPAADDCFLEIWRRGARRCSRRWCPPPPQPLTRLPTARRNEELYEAAFRPLPSDLVASYEDIARRKEGLPDSVPPPLGADGQAGGHVADEQQQARQNEPERHGLSRFRHMVTGRMELGSAAEAAPERDAEFLAPERRHVPPTADMLRVPTMEEYEHLARNVRGVLVPFPLHFLCNSRLLPPTLAPETMVMPVFK